MTRMAWQGVTHNTIPRCEKEQHGAQMESPLTPVIDWNQANELRWRLWLKLVKRAFEGGVKNAGELDFSLRVFAILDFFNAEDLSSSLFKIVTGW